MVFFECCPGSAPAEEPTSALKADADVTEVEWAAEDGKDYEDLQHIAMKREIKITMKKSTQAGIAAGLSVMAGVLVAGPVGAVVGGAVGTAMAAKLAKDVVPLTTLLDQTPKENRLEVMNLFRVAFQEEFTETIDSSPELKLLLGGATILGVVRYAMVWLCVITSLQRLIRYHKFIYVINSLGDFCAVLSFTCMYLPIHEI